MALITMNIEKDERRTKMLQSKDHSVCDNKIIESREILLKTLEGKIVEAELSFENSEHTIWTVTIPDDEGNKGQG